MISNRPATTVFMGVAILAAALALTSRAEAGPVVGCHESTSLPIKICYDGAEDLATAESLMPDVEDVWSFYIDELGFNPPWRLDDEGKPEEGLYIFLTDLGDDWGGAIPVADIPSTPESDCAASLEINKMFDPRYLGFIVSQQMGSILLMANDCVEALSTGFSMYMFMAMRRTRTDFPFEMFLQYMGAQYFLAYQANTHLALDYEDYSNPDLASYGSGQSLFYMYIDESWGDGTGSIMAEIVNATGQEGTVVVSAGTAELESGENEPDIYDAIDTVLADYDGSFWDAVKEFAIWRVFTGEIADSEHLEYGPYFPGLTFYDSFEMIELPRTGLLPMSLPQETGTAYINVYVDGSAVSGAEDLLQLDIRSDESPNWTMAAVIFNLDGTSNVVELDVTEGRGFLVADNLASVMNVVFAVTNLGDLDHDPDDDEFSSNQFIYGIDFYKKPSIDTVSPDKLTQGAVGVELEITGSELKPGIEVDLGEGVAVEVDTVTPDGRKIIAAVDVDADAAIGKRDLRVFYENGLEAVLDEAVEVQSGEPPVITTITPDSASTGRSVNIEIVGERFQPGLTVQFDGEGITVTQVDVVNEGSAIAGIEIAAAAEAGDHSVTVTNPDEKSDTLEAGFAVLAGQDGGDGDGDDGEGCSCSAVGSGGAPGGFMFLFFLVAGILIIVSKNRRFFMKKTTRILFGGLCLALLWTLPAASSAESSGDSVEARINRIYDLLFPDIGSKSSAASMPGYSYTMNRLQAFRILKDLPQEKQDELTPLFAPPVPLGCLESEIYPIRSCYNDEEEIPKAQAVLEWAEESWELEVDTLGFYAPIAARREGDEVGMDFFLGDTRSSGASGYTSPEDMYAPTPHTDCSSYIVMDETLNEENETWKTVVGHELMHGCQMAMDCYETLNSMESTTVWTEHLLAPGVWDYFSYAVAEYQDNPDHSIGWNEYNSMYVYGAALHMQFVQEFLGDNDPLSIRRLWEGTLQTWADNEPDLFDAVMLLAGENDVDLATYVSTFGEWRYFMGSRDDGNHFENGSEWYNVDVVLAGMLSASTPSRFPLSTSGDVHQLGYHYESLYLDPESIPRGTLLVKFQANASSSWIAELWLIKDGTLDEKISILSDEDGRGEFTADSEDMFAADEMMFMIANIGDEELDWDQNWGFEHFSVVFDYLFYPALDSVTPDTLYLGEETEVTVTGQYIEPGLDVQISGDGVEILSADMMSSEEIILTVSVDRDAATGPRDLVVSNYEDHEGFETTMEDAIQIAVPPPPEITALFPNGAEPGESPIVRVDGANLSDDNEVTFSCADITVTRTDFVDDTTLFVHLDIADEAEEQACDITVEDSFDQSDTAAEAFSITLYAPDDEHIAATGGACGCAMVR
ncbi:MAG: IPT/TIG domain-containing protein [Pseudomonadota bacterium]